ncbi:uncharacterized protein LOC135502547 [Lineus longissimus]|uniref:uncharacterized protein LOC135502547 n=1 Tax=Lineus longissimus TaxID=88925 RepID=UPI00315DF187
MAAFSEYKLDLLFVSLLFNVMLIRASYPQCETITKNSCSGQDEIPTTVMPTIAEAGEYPWEHSELVHYLHRSCFCDELCKVHDDCCSDFQDNVDTNEGTKSTDSVYGTRLELYKKHLSLSPLTSIFGYHTDGVSKREAIMGTCWVETCPEYFQEESVRKLCDDDRNTYGDKFLWWPVSNMKTGITYRNMYCALCWDDREIVFWEISVGCTFSNDYTGEYFDSLMADPLMADDNENSRPKRSEATTDSGIKPSDPEAGPNSADVTPSGGTDILTKLQRCNKYLLNPFGIRNLRNFKLNIISVCPGNWTDTTVAEFCGNYTYIIYDNSTTNHLYKNIHCALCNGVREENIVCNWKHMDSITLSLGFGSSMQPFYPITVLFEPLGGRVTVTDGEKVQNDPLQNCGKNQIFDLFQQKCRKVFCPPLQEFINGTCIRRFAPRVMAFRPLPPNGSDIQPGIMCPEVKYGPEEFKILENGNVVFNGDAREFNASNFRLVNGSLYLCAHHVVSKNVSVGMVRTIYEFENAAMIISATGQIFSIVCLALNFVIYAILPPLRNTPGKTLMSLVLALFLSQLTFLVGAGRTNNYITCVLAATLIHYFILASFVWMNALSLDLALAFSATNLHSTDEKAKRRRFIAFSLYGWLAPLLVVGISLVLDLFGDATGEFRPRYGRHICWISNPSAVGLLFILPLAILLTINLVLYIFTAVNIYKATVAADMVRKRDKRSLLIYIKLSVIMGGTWIFAFVWIITKSSVVQYTFIILNSLQGAFIFFSFVFRRKVYYMLRQYYGPDRKRSTSSTGKAAAYSYTTDGINNRLYTVNPQPTGIHPSVMGTGRPTAL